MFTKINTQGGKFKVTNEIIRIIAEILFHDEKSILLSLNKLKQAFFELRDLRKKMYQALPELGGLKSGGPIHSNGL